MKNWQHKAWKTNGTEIAFENCWTVRTNELLKQEVRHLHRSTTQELWPVLGIFLIYTGKKFCHDCQAWALQVWLPFFATGAKWAWQRSAHWPPCVAQNISANVRLNIICHADKRLVGSIDFGGNRYELLNAVVGFYWNYLWLECFWPESESYVFYKL